METIRNLSDLCSFFGADAPWLLNHRMYKDTGCGASISIHVGKSRVVKYLYTFIFEQEKSHPVVKDIRKGGRYADYSDVHVDVRHLFRLRKDSNDNIFSSVFDNLKDFVDACQKFCEKDKTFVRVRQEEDFVKILSVEKVIEKFPDDTPTLTGVKIKVLHNHLHDNSRWLHNGDKWEVTKRTNLLGFTIQTIVEGSDVTIDSEEFVVPVSTQEVDDWIQEMEAQASFYWNRDNLTHWKLTDPNGKEYFFDSGWGENKWHDEGVPETVKKKVAKWIEGGVDDDTVQVGKRYRFGVKDWYVEEYDDDSTY